MPHDARKKERQRLKRKQKQAKARKAAALTPLERIARSGGELECYVNAEWREGGMASIHVLGRAPDGRLAYAAFLVDVWCVGLKDAFGHRQISRQMFDDMLDRAERQLETERISPAEARRLVAGGVRFARQNGFHLPPHFERWTAIFGGLGDVVSADLSDFGVDGGLRYIGTEQFLRKRLAACSVEAFLARPDVQWVMGGGALRDASELIGESDDDEDEADQFDGGGLDLSDGPMIAELADILGTVGDRLEDAVRKWCFRSGQPPHPMLRQALNTVLASAMPTAMYDQAVDEGVAPADEPSPVPDPAELMEINLADVGGDERRSLEEAIGQVSAFMRQFKVPADMLASLNPPGGGAAPHA